MFYLGFTVVLLLFSSRVVSNSLQLHGMQHTRLPCASLFPQVSSNSCSLRWWCHPTISSCHPLLPLPSIFLSIGAFPKSHLFASSGQGIRASASAPVLPVISPQGYKGQEFFGGRSILPPTEDLCPEQWLPVLGSAAGTSQLRDLNQVAWPFFASVSSFVNWEIQQCLSHGVIGS